jgi:hypothetical protein
MIRFLLICLGAVVIPLGASQAENWKNKSMAPSSSMTIRGRVVCRASTNCWCNSKRKTLTAGEACACGDTSGVLKYEAQVKGVAYCQ